jgi:hypothetical protein
MPGYLGEIFVDIKAAKLISSTLSHLLPRRNAPSALIFA